MSKPRFGTKQKHIIGERWSLEIDIHKTGGVDESKDDRLHTGSDSQN